MLPRRLHLAAVAAVLVLGASACSSSSSPATPPATTATTTATTTRSVSVYAGLPQHGDTLGRADAPATLTIYEDPQCPFCRQWTADTLPRVVREFVRSGKVKLVYRGIAVIGPNSQPGVRAILAAGRQNKLWNVAGALYALQGAENTGWITTSVIRRAAAAAGADPAAVVAAMPSKAVTAALAQANNDALENQIQGTPVFLLQRPPSLPRALGSTSLAPGPFTAELTAALR